MPNKTSGTIIDVSPVTEASINAEATAAKRAAAAEIARANAAQLMTDRKFTQAKKALDEADTLLSGPTAEETKETERKAQAETLRAQAAQLMSERKFAEARNALEDAEQLETEPSKWKAHPQRLFTAIRSRLPKREHGADAVADAGLAAPVAELNPVDKSMEIVSLYSKIAAAAGVLPGGLLNFAAILAVQVTMVWRIAKVFGHDESKDRVRGSVLSLIGSVIPTGIGHGTALAVASIPAALAGAVIYFVATPVLAYALTRAVGNAFIMHFESGGTLLTFDPKAFGDHFIKEFREAGGVVADVVVQSGPPPDVVAAS